MDPVALVAAGAAIAAAIWARQSAKAATRTASAEERSADAADKQLRLEQERLERERRASEEAVAPRVVPTADYGEEFTLRGEELVGLVANEGKSAATVDAVTLEHVGGTASGRLEWSPLPCRLGRDVAAAVSFPIGADEARAVARGPPLAVVFEFCGEDERYRGRTSFRLFRDGADAEGNPHWRAERPKVERLD